MKREIRDPFLDLELLTNVVCPKCGTANPGEAQTCENCHRHLLIFCGHCGHPNYRNTLRCVECRSQLHIPGHRRMKEAKARKWIKPVEAALLIATVFLTAKGVVKVAQFELPKHEPPAPQVYVLKPDGTWYLK